MQELPFDAPTRKNLWGDLVDAAVDDHAAARGLLAEHPWLLEYPKYLGETVLHFCAIENFVTGVEFMLSAGATPNCVNQFGNSPLQEVVGIHNAGTSYREMIEVLLIAGADPLHESRSRPSSWHQVSQPDEDKAHRYEAELVELMRGYVRAFQ